jgi:Cu/Ag efflux protein CusF
VGSSEGTNPAIAAYRACLTKQEIAMKIATIVLAGTAALTVIGSAALAQQALTGTLTKVDRISRTLAIRQTQDGTVGANTGGAAEEFKAQDGLSLDTWHAGDRVSFSVSETGGVKTITKLQKQ